MRRLWAQVRFEHRLFLRDRTVIAFHIVLPVVLMCLLARVYGGILDARKRIGVVDEGRSVNAETLITGLRDIGAFEMVGGSKTSVYEDYEAGGLAAVVVFGGDGERDGGRSVRIESDVETGAVLTAILRGLRENPSEWIQRTVAVRDRQAPLVRALLPGIVGMVVASVGLFGFGARIAAYRQRGFLARLGLTPFGVSQFIAAQVVQRIAFMVTQGLFLVSLGGLIGVRDGDVSWLYLCIALLSGSAAFLGIGLCIGGRASSAEAANGWCHLLFFPMLLLSGAFYPVSALPSVLRPLCPLFPMTYLLDAVRSSFGATGRIGVDSAVLASWGAASMILSIRTLSTRGED